MVKRSLARELMAATMWLPVPRSSWPFADLLIREASQRCLSGPRLRPFDAQVRYSDATDWLH
jgi:hypothetical protein